MVKSRTEISGNIGAHSIHHVVEKGVVTKPYQIPYRDTRYSTLPAGGQRTEIQHTGGL